MNLLILHILYRSAGNNHTVKFLLPDLIKCDIKLIQMAGRRIL